MAKNVETVSAARVVAVGQAAANSARRSAFSLAELIVVMGVMVLMLSLAGQVMSLTVRASGQATAFTETMQGVREMERTLREDLRHVRRDRSVMVIQGNPVNAYWTADGRDADNDGNPATGYPFARNPDREDRSNPASVKLIAPRADMLMFFTERKANTYITYESKNFQPTQVSSQIQQVVYGHALLGEYEKSSGASSGYALQFPVDYDPVVTPPPFPPFPTFWRVPAAQWHLSRRVVHLLPVSPPNIPTMKPAMWRDYTTDRLDNPALLKGETDILAAFNYEAALLTPSLQLIGQPPKYWPEMGDSTIPYARSQIDPTPPPAMVHTLGHYMMPYCASFKVEWGLDAASSFVAGKLNYENGLYWIDPGYAGADPATPNDDEPLYAIIKAQMELEDNGISPRDQLLLALLDAPQGRYHNDPTMPPVSYSLRNRFGGGSMGDPTWRDPLDDQRPNLHVFVANRGGTPSAPIADEIFPKALRITVDVYDKLQRLDQPIRHVMILPVGEE